MMGVAAGGKRGVRTGGPTDSSSSDSTDENVPEHVRVQRKIIHMEALMEEVLTQTEKRSATLVDPHIDEFAFYLKDLNEKVATDEHYHPYPAEIQKTHDPYHPDYQCTGMTYAKIYIYEFCHNQHWDFYSSIMHNITIVCILVSVIASVLESVEEFSTSPVFVIIEGTTTGIFTIELTLRFIGIRNRMAYACDMLNLLDILATVPFYIAQLFPNLPAVGGMLRVFRLTRLSRLRGIKNRFTPLVVKTYILFMKDILASILILIIISLLVFGNLIVLMEKGAPPYHYPNGFSEIDNIPQAMWWTLITMTTVGYGDYYPVTPGGKFLTLFTVVMGMSITALMLLIVGELFQRAKMEADDEVLKIAESFERAGLIDTIYDDLPEDTTNEDLYEAWTQYQSTLVFDMSQPVLNGEQSLRSAPDNA